ncbi:protein Aster-B isoform X3 [Drosophila tropicalis]
MIKDIDIETSKSPPVHASNMLADSQQQNQQQEQQTQQQHQEQQQQQQQQQQLDIPQLNPQLEQNETELNLYDTGGGAVGGVGDNNNDGGEDGASNAADAADRRESITEEITITTTTTNNALGTKLLTIQEASSGVIEKSTISISTSSSASQQRYESVAPNNSSNSISTNSSSSSNISTSTTITNPQLNTPSINIAVSEKKEQQQQQQQPLQSQSVDSNGFTPATTTAGSYTDSPNSRKSSTSSKGKPTQAKLSTSSSGRDEDNQSKLSEGGGVSSESSSNTFVRGDSQQQVISSSTSNDKPATGKSTSRLSERAKKKSWYNVIYPNYKSRAEDFKKLFKEVPNDERLIVDYSCALQRDILVQGRLYVSQNYVCFHANIFSWETYLTIKWRDVTAITKEKTALVIPNAISIATAKDKYFFATFAARDKSFLMLFRVWQNTLMNKPFSPQEIWKYVHNCYGEELGLTTDDEDYIDPTLDNDNETDLELQSAVDDYQGQIQLLPQQQQQQQQQSGNSSASSASGGSAALSSSSVTAAAPRKSKTKYFFNSSKSSNLNSSANASASGSDNQKADNTRKSNKKMKTNAKELTLSSVKPAEQTVGVTLSTHSSTTTASTTAATTTTLTNSSSNTATGAAAATSHTASSNADKRNVEKVSSSTSVSTITAPSVESSNKRKLSKNQRQQREVELAGKNASEAAPTDVSDSSDSEENNVPFVPTTECTSTHEGRQIVHTILPISVDTLFNFLFSKSKFITDFHAMRKSTDLILGEWSKNDEGQNVRLVNVTVQLAASVGPKTSKVTEYQTMRECSKPGELYSIDVNSVNAGIPYADSFSVLIHYCLARTVDDHTMLSIHAQIKYKKSIWGVVKGFIEKNTWAGLEDFFGSQLHALQSETCIPPAKGKGRRPRRGINQQHQQQQLQSDTTATTAASNSTDNDSIREPYQHSHPYAHPHQHPLHQHQSTNHQHQHLHMHHHHHHHHLHHQSSSPQQHAHWQHRQAIFQSSNKGTATQVRPLEEATGSTAQINDTLESQLLSGGGVSSTSASAASAADGLMHEGKLQKLGGHHHHLHQQQQHLSGSCAAGAMGGVALAMGQGQHGFRHRGLSLFVILLMCLLLALNVILLLKLWKLEERIDVDLTRRARMPSLAALKELPNTNQDWLELLHQQEISHESELRKWHQVLQTAIELLKKVSIVCEKIYNDGQLRHSIESLSNAMHTEF